MFKNANSTKVITKKVRLSYVHLLEAFSQAGGEPKFSTTLIIPKTDTETLKRIKDAQLAAYEAAKMDRLKGVAFESVTTTLHDGDVDADLDTNPELENSYYIAVSSKTKPGIIDRFKEEVTSPDDVYSGVYARVSLNFYAYNTHGNRGISAGLNNVQIIAKGEYLGGRASADSDFDEWDDEDDDLLG